MNGKQKVSLPNGLRRFIEGSPLITLCAVTISIAGAIFGALNWVKGVEVAKIQIDSKRTEDGLKEQYKDKIRQLDDERSRIQFAVGDQSSIENALREGGATWR
jgi:hypothetical protein